MSPAAAAWRRFPFLDHDGPIPIAHRGGAAAAPENTMRAFAHAVSLGYRYLETDVHVTADGVALAFHDHVLDRVTDRVGVVANLSWPDIASARVAGTDEIVRLSDLLEAFPDCLLNLDPKHDAAVPALAEAVRRAGAIDRVCVGSFSDERIATVRSLLGENLAVSAGPRAVARLRLASLGVPVKAIRAACVQVPTHVRGVRVVDRRFVSEAHRRGLAVHVWTIDEPTEMVRLLELGVDGIMTDQPAVLRQVLVERGQWSETPAG
jgi:glycerophosphoryl diester phosphodiesterase